MFKRVFLVAIGSFVFCLACGMFAKDVSVFAQDVRVSGYHFYGHTSDWNWAPIETSDPVAEVSSDSDGYTMVMSMPEAKLAGLNTDNVRVGITSGEIGSQSMVWISSHEPFAADADEVPSPWTSKLISQAALRQAKILREQDQFRIQLVFDTAPDLRSPWDLYFLIDVDGSQDSGFKSGDYLIQNTRLIGGESGLLNVAWFEIRPGILEPGEETEVTAWIQNDTEESMSDVAVHLSLPDGVVLRQDSPVGSIDLQPKQAKRITWKVSATRTGWFQLLLQVDAESSRTSARKRLSVVATRDPKREFQTAKGAWLPYPQRPSLQEGNRKELSHFMTLPSSKLKHNLFGITTHLPRGNSSDEEPFDVSHVVDGDPTTCWASRWWRTAIPFEPEWVRIDLGKVQQVSEVRFLPAWKNSGMPAAFTIEVSTDGHRWDNIVEELDYHLQEVSENDPLRFTDLTWQRFPLAQQQSFRYVRLKSTHLKQENTSFFCAPFHPFQLRVAEIVLLDSNGIPIDVSKNQPVASTTHHAWYNTPETVDETWPLVLNSGVKINRVGQWGDKTNWATVEKIKGVYTIDPDIDRAITESVEKGVEINLTLAYGNNLYQKLKDPVDHGPTWHRGHPFIQCAPTSKEALEGFANYCTFMAKHFRGRVKYFEIWNEENGWFFDAWADNNSVELVKAYGRALAVGAKAIKEANPEAIVVFGGVAGPSLDFPRIALEQGAGPYIDIFAFHPYGHETPESAPTNLLTDVAGMMKWEPSPPEIKNYEQEIAAFRTLVHQYNPNMEVWVNEMNWFAPGEPAGDYGDQSELSQAKHLSRFFSINNWLGCGSVWWSLYNANHIQEWALVRSSDRTPRGAYYSAGYVSTVLDDTQAASDVTVEVVGSAPEDLLVKVYRNGDGELLVGLWRTSNPDDACQPVPVTLCLPERRFESVELVDTVYGYQQAAVLRHQDDGTVAEDLLVGDWPLFLKLAP